MIGMVVSTWIKTGRQLYGDDKMEIALKKVGWDIDKRFTPLEVVEDITIKQILEGIAESTNSSLQQIWTEIGTDNLKVFTRKYPLFFSHDNLYGFLKALDTIHKAIVARMPSSKPPFIDITPIGRREAIFTYQSNRGMFDYMHAMLKASAEHFGESLKVDILEQTSDCVKVKLTFEKDIYQKKKYWLNTIFSLGFIQKVEVKIALATLLSLLLSHSVLGYLFKNIGFIDEVVGTLIAYIFTYFLLSPMKSLKQQMKNLIDKNYLEDCSIETKDSFEELSKMVTEAVKNSSNSVISMEGIADEINDCNSTFEERLRNSHSIFNEITSAIEQVSQGACQQAVESENTVKILNENSIVLKKIVASQNKSQENLIAAVGEINVNQKNIELTSANLHTATEKFSELNSMSTELQNEAKEIINIVTTVASIAEETSLLSLNASIEAARAGESGKGFAVVAEEIGKLSSSSKNAALEISRSLDHFIQRINELTEKVDTQYIILNSENDKLNAVAESSASTAKNIDIVLKEMIDAIRDINNEMQELQKVYGKVEALAAIGEENAAMSEEVNASVSTYSAEINDIIKNIKELTKITEKFSEGLSSYRM